MEDVVTDTTMFPEPPDIQIPNAHDENEPLRRGCRVKYPSTWLQDYVIHTIQKLSPSTRSSTQSHFSCAPYPITHYVNYEKISLPHRHFLAAITTEKEPLNFHEAVKDAR